MRGARFVVQLIVVLLLGFAWLYLCSGSSDRDFARILASLLVLMLIFVGFRYYCGVWRRVGDSWARVFYEYLVTPTAAVSVPLFYDWFDFEREAVTGHSLLAAVVLVSILIAMTYRAVQFSDYLLDESVLASRYEEWVLSNKGASRADIWVMDVEVHLVLISSVFL